MDHSTLIIFTNDWELRNYDGNMIDSQIKPLVEIENLFEKYSYPITFFVETMQQLTMRRMQAEHPELQNLADKWDYEVLNAYKRGHDIQLHIHPQWKGAEYQNPKWIFDYNWDLKKYSEIDVDNMVRSGKEYIEKLFFDNGITHTVKCFRSGWYTSSPSNYIGSVLKQHGIIGIADLLPGIKKKNEHIEFDYRKVKRDYIPFEASLRDMRFPVKPCEDYIWSIPNFTFQMTFIDRLLNHMKRQNNGKKNIINKTLYIADNTRTTLAVRQKIDKVLYTPIMETNIGNNTYYEIHSLYKNIQKLSRNYSDKQKVIVIVDHTKNYSDPFLRGQQLANVEYLLRQIKKNNRIKVITMSALLDILERNNN